MGMGDSAEEMVQLVLMIVRALVDRPEKVTVDVTQVAEVTVLTLRVAIKDRGKVIGRGGRIAQSVRIIVQAASMKMKRRFLLDISESPEESGDLAKWSLEGPAAG